MNIELPFNTNKSRFKSSLFTQHHELMQQLVPTFSYFCIHCYETGFFLPTVSLLKALLPFF